MPAVEHRFTGPSYTLGIEEELMIVDAETLELTNSVEAMLQETPDVAGEVKPELMESVLEIATTPCANTAEAGAELRELRRRVHGVAADRGLAIGWAGTRRFALWEEQRIVSRPRYRDLVAQLGFVARQELIFGAHVHVGLDDADKAIHVANGMRVHVPLLLALSANSPFWRADAPRSAAPPTARTGGCPPSRSRAPARRPPARSPGAASAAARRPHACCGWAWSRSRAPTP